ncbi:MAG: VWA domain-containing protein [Planctomycetaceae bacterium]|nr:VWA domain-containing protein [Planctomycetaceae bacterium]
MNLPTLTSEERHTLARWRLVLGRDAEQEHITCAGDDECERIESLVGFLFEKTGSGGQQKQGDRKGGLGSGHALTVPEWIDAVTELFPRSAKEVMERELVQRRGIHELLDQPKLLEKVEPNLELVKTLLTHKDLLNPKTRVLARKIIDQVVQQLKQKMKLQVESAITGALRRDRHSPRKVFRNLDLKTTIRRNLQNYNTEREKLFVDRMYFFAAERKKRPWHVIVTVDQSGSMLDSAIFSAVMASIFAELPSVRTSLVLFDTAVVDLSDRVGAPVDVLLSIQLGGGTDITQAMIYSQQLAREPARTIVVLITDFYEGRDERDLINQVKEMSQSGIRMIGLGALGYDARPEYNKSTAKKCRKAGMDILVCTPERLAECMAEIIRG